MKKTHKVLKKPKSFLLKTPKAEDVTLAKDDKGYFVYTHRWQSKRYPSIEDIPKSVIIYCESTG